MNANEYDNKTTNQNIILHSEEQREKIRKI